MREKDPLDRLPYFRCRPADYLLDTGTLSQGEHGAYWLLMAHYYWNGRLPVEIESIYEIARAVDEPTRAAADKVLRKYFHHERGRTVHHRIERELAAYGQMIRSNSKAGKKSGEARAAKSGKPMKSKPSGNGEHVEIPDWLNAEQFAAWFATRPARARSAAAKRAAVAELEQFKAQGHDPNAIVAKALSSGWQGLFAPKGKPVSQEPDFPL